MSMYKDESLKLISESKESQPDFVKANEKIVNAWFSKTLINLKHIFGEESEQYQSLKEI